MADDQDSSQKTEEPTQKKLDDAEREGNIAKSQEINNWFAIAGATLSLVVFGRPIALHLLNLMQPFLEKPQEIATDPISLVHLLRDVAGSLAMMLGPLVILMLLAGFAAGAVQHKPDISFDRLQLNFARLNPLGGLKNMVSLQGLANLVKSLLKLAVVSGVVLEVVWPRLKILPSMVSVDVADILPETDHLVVTMLIAICAVLGVVAGADFLYQKWDHIRGLRMSKQDLKDESKQNEGDPMVKARLRAVRAERSRRRMMASVPEADVVVTNPTHFAVALKYDNAVMAAPKVVAKGQDLVALRIRELAGQHKVPIVENPPLARALYATCDIDQEIPVEHYQAVAEIIGYVMRLKGKLPSRRPAGA